MTAFRMQELEASGWQGIASLTTSWSVVRHGEDLLGDFRAAARTLRLRAVLDRLRYGLVNRPGYLEGVKLVVLNQLPGSHTEQIGAVPLVAPETGRKLGAGVAQQIGAEVLQALNALQTEAYRRMVNRDLVDEFRTVDAKRPAWMLGEQPVDPMRAALVRAGRRQTLWRRIRGGAAEHLDVPKVQPTDPRVMGRITLDGSIITITERHCRLSIQGACKASPLAKELGIAARTFVCQDPELFNCIRTIPPGQSMSLEVEVVESIAFAGELKRTYVMTGLKAG